jgi:hypothetical protein
VGAAEPDGVRVAPVSITDSPGHAALLPSAGADTLGWVETRTLRCPVARTTSPPREAGEHLGCPSQVAGPGAPGPLLMSAGSYRRDDAGLQTRFADSVHHAPTCPSTS